MTTTYAGLSEQQRTHYTYLLYAHSPVCREARCQVSIILGSDEFPNAILVHRSPDADGWVKIGRHAPTPAIDPALADEVVKYAPELGRLHEERGD